MGPVLSCPVKEFDHDLCVYDLDYVKVLLYKSSTLYEEKDEGPRQSRAIGLSENRRGRGRGVSSNAVDITFPLVEIGVN